MAGERDLRAARRYATALFAAAQKQAKLDPVTRDLHTVVDLMDRTPALSEMWGSKVVPTGKKRDLISKLFASTVDPLSLAFLRLLVDKRREDILSLVHMEVQQLTDASRRLVRAEATFALQPTPEERQKLVQSLEKRTGEHVDLSIHVDPSILGGVVVRMHDTIVDGSVRGTLERLREQLLQDI
jgi:F-type H+-transporting ATPase subunit delta